MNAISNSPYHDVSEILSKSMEWHTARSSGIGGSDAKRIMDGDWLALWREKTGRTQPEDLSANLAVAMGTFTEPLNRYWFTKQTGVAVTPVPEARVHPQHPFMRANLDGLCGDGAVFEAKHVNAFSKDDEVVSRYFPQIQHYMEVTGASLTRLSVIFGSNKWVYFDVARDDVYIAELVEWETQFWNYITLDEPPPSRDGSAQVVVTFDAMREVDMTASNSWADCAADWMDNRDAAKKFDAATKGIKEMIDPDVKRAFGNGVVASRSKSGAISIRCEK